MENVIQFIDELVALSVLRIHRSGDYNVRILTVSTISASTERIAKFDSFLFPNVDLKYVSINFNFENSFCTCYRYNSR